MARLRLARARLRLRDLRPRAHAAVPRGEPLTSDTLGTLIGPFQYFLLYRAVLVALPDAAQQRTLLKLLLLASIPVSLSAIFQHFHLFGVRGVIPDITGVDVDRDYDDAYGVNAQGGGDRATGTFPHWQVLGGYEFWIVLLGSRDDALQAARAVRGNGCSS